MAIGVPEDLARIEAELLASGGYFAIETTEVNGASVQAFASRARSLGELLEGSLNRADAPYFTFTDGAHERSLTFGEHAAVVGSVAAALRDQYGVQPGDRVAILAANTAEWIVTFWATVSLGAIAVGLNGWSTATEIEYFLGDSEPRLLVADAKRLARLDRRAVAAPVVEMEREFGALEEYAPGAALPDVPIAEDDPAIILYTSGTTGRPKGAVNTHRNMIAFVSMNFFGGARTMMLHPPPPGMGPRCQLMTNPLFHVSGLHAGAVMLLASGVRSVWLTGRFDAEVAMQVIERERCTGWSYTETMLHRFLNHPALPNYDLTSVMSVGGGGSPIAPSIFERTRQVFPNAAPTMGYGYGQTECAALATMNLGQELVDFPLSVGRPLPTVELEIRSPNDTPLAEGEEGEVCVKGPMVMPGYWRRPEENANTIRDGWLHTGDIGRMEGGRLYLSSRKRDLIFRGGENVYPVEIEKRIEDHPAVEECAVIGVDDPDLGQAVKAVVVAAPGATIDVESLRAWTADALAYYKVPAHWEVRDALPRNAAGKILKDALRTGEDAAFVEE
ncbi:MAG TPA: class I adenylate-forming enzyme family protein [Acidimicrobiia bacterium]|nr:class I adenylate-forming enzyme family protein [Acidimicrobiia bacterium]